MGLGVFLKEGFSPLTKKKTAIPIIVLSTLIYGGVMMNDFECYQKELRDYKTGLTDERPSMGRCYTAENLDNWFDEHSFWR